MIYRDPDSRTLRPNWLPPLCPREVHWMNNAELRVRRFIYARAPDLDPASRESIALIDRVLESRASREGVKRAVAEL
jgi:hypothetical protein